MREKLVKAQRGERATPDRKRKPEVKRRVSVTMQTAAMLGLTKGEKERRLSWRANDRLVQAARQTSGLDGSDLLEYALAKVALDDDYVEELFGASRHGRSGRRS